MSDFDLGCYLSIFKDASYITYNNKELYDIPGVEKFLLTAKLDEVVIRNGYRIAIGKKTVKDDFLIKLETDRKEVDFAFSKEEFGRVHILSGKNGRGKSYMLNLFINSLLGTAELTQDIPYFNRLIVSSFSLFDLYPNNEIAGEMISHSNQYSQSSIDISDFYRKGNLFFNSYKYVGVKSGSTSVLSIENSEDRAARSFINVMYFCYKHKSLREKKINLMESTLRKAIDFHKVYICHNEEQLEINLHTDIREIKRVLVTHGLSLSFYNSEGDVLDLSSGQKIYSYLIPSLVDAIVEESLIIIDEPELYLHPELEVDFMDILREILHEMDSFSIISTHSSIIIRESKRECVHIVDYNSVRHPEIETYGASLDKIIGSVFYDDEKNKPFQKHLKNDYEESGLSIDDYLLKESRNLGDDALLFLLSLRKNHLED